MSSFWRKCYKKIFGLSLIISTISVVVIACDMISNHNSLGWLLLFAGVFFVIGAHALLGALLEMMYNIAALRDKYCGAYDTWACPKCKTQNKIKSNLCINCGYDIDKIVNGLSSHWERIV